MHVTCFFVSWQPSQTQTAGRTHMQLGRTCDVMNTSNYRQGKKLAIMASLVQAHKPGEASPGTYGMTN